MEDRGGQAEGGDTAMETITTLHPAGASGSRSEVVML